MKVNGKTLKLLRVLRGVRARDLAALVGTYPSVYSEVEADRNELSEDAILTILTYLNVTPAELERVQALVKGETIHGN